MRFSLFITALALSIPLLGQTGNTLIQPDCLIPFTFSAPGSFPATPTTNGAGDNRTKGCANWTLMYQNTGMTSVTVTLQSGSTPTTTVSWGTFAGSVTAGYSNPIVSDTGGSLQATNGTADISWVRVNVAATGTGTLTGVLYGFRNASAKNGGGGGGSGTVTSIATGCFLTGGPITISGTISASETVNAQTGTSYAILNSDCGKLVTGTNAGSEAYSIAQAGGGGSFASGWFIDLQNRGAGTLTLTPATSTVDGAATLVLASGQGVRIVSDGSNYFTERGMANTGGVCPAGSAGAVQKTDGTNCVASSITDDGSTVAIAEPLASPVLTTPTLPLGSLAGPPVASYNAGIQGEFSLAPTGMGVIDQESTFPNVLKVIKQSSTASSASAAISGRGYGVGATNLAYLGGVEGETTYHGTGNPVLLFGSAGHVIVDAASTPGLATAFYADGASISNTTVPFVTSFYAKAPALGSGGAVTTFAPLYLFGRPLGADLNILIDLGTIQLVTARTTAGTTDSPVYSLRASSYDTVAHTVDWQTIDHPTSNAGASSFRIQNQVDGAGFVDKLAVDSAGNVTAASFTGTGSNPFINFPSNPTHTGAAGDLWNNAGILNFGATPTQVVMGPASATASDLACYNGTTGALLKDCTVLPNGTTATTQSQNDNSTKPATTAYTDLAVANGIAGVNPAVAVVAASTANVTGTYANGASGIGATFTVTATGAFSLDGTAINTIGQRVLLKNQSSGFQNGIYTATVVGAVAVSPVFTRALDYNTPSNINSTGAIPVQSGTVNTTTSWLLTSTVTAVGTDALTYVQFSVNPSVVTQTIASGAKALATSSISSATCTAAQTDTATGTATTDAIVVSFNGDPTAVTGYVPLTTGMLTIIPYPTANTVNFKVCNNTSASITPGAVTLNWRVVR